MLSGRNTGVDAKKLKLKARVARLGDKSGIGLPESPPCD